jgi:hypothetical protein
MRQFKNLLVLSFKGYTIKHSAEYYILSKDGDVKGKHNTYHSTIDNAVVHLAEARIPEKIAEKSDYQATLAELVEIVKEVRREITSALSMAGIGSGSDNSKHPDNNTAVKPGGV